MLCCSPVVGHRSSMQCCELVRVWLVNRGICRNCTTHESRTGQVQPNQRSSQGVVEVPDLQRTYDALKAAS